MPPVHQENLAHSPRRPEGSGSIASATDLWVAAEDRLALLQILNGAAESAERWLEARIVLLAAQGTPADEISEIAGVDGDGVRAVIDRFVRDGVRC